MTEDSTTETSTSQSHTAQSHTAQSDTAQSDTAQSDTAQSDTAQSDTAQSDTAQSDGEDGYVGPAELVVEGDAPVDVEVSLRGHFDPISGSYRWYGRVAASDAVAGLVASSARSLVLRTPHGEVMTGLFDVDPWGRPRVEGFGAAPFEVLDSLPD